MALDCDGDMRDFSRARRRNMGRAIKEALENAPNCDFKPCGYTMDSGDDITPVNAFSFEFPIQGNAVCRCGDADAYCSNQSSASVATHWRLRPLR